MTLRRLATARLLTVAVVAVASLAAAGAATAASAAAGATGSAADPSAPTEAQAALLAATQTAVDAHPGVLGSVVLDAASGRVTVRRAPGASEAAARAALAAADDARVRAATVASGSLSAERIETVLDQVYDVRLPGGARVYSAAYDAGADVVRVEVDSATDEVRAAISRAVGSAVDVVAGSPMGSDAAADAYFPTGRAFARSPFPGGAGIIIKPVVTASPVGSCSTGFSWRTSSGASRMITAGHCFPQGTANNKAYTHRGDAGTPIWSVHLGTAVASTFKGGVGTVPYNGALRGDLAILSIPAGSSSGPTIYVDSGSTYKQLYVIGTMTRRPAVGDKFCISAAWTGETCGWTVTSTSASFTDSDTGERFGGLVAGENSGPCTHKGDSGGPVYIKNSVPRVIAKGIHSGGASSLTGGRCRAYFTPIQNATDAFGGRIAQL